MSSIPEPRKFFLEIPPYATFQFSTDQFIGLLKIQFFRDTLDAHCLECNKEAVFQSVSPPLREALGPPRTHGPARAITVEELEEPHRFVSWPFSTQTRPGQASCLTLPQLEPLVVEDRTFDVTFSCTRNKTHLIIFIFRITNKTISKIGQSPSLADLHAGDIGKYRKVLGKERHAEFAKAIGLNAHGVGIGAFVYLRRIFEWLIDTARGEATKENGWDEGAFTRLRMDEKILRLTGHLPPFLVANRQIYSILSLGIHELKEMQCLTYFASLKAGIELILDEEIERRNRAEKEERFRKELTIIKSELRGG